MTTKIIHDEWGRAYSFSPLNQYKIRDITPTVFIKDPNVREYFERYGRRINMYTEEKKIVERTIKKVYYLPRAAYEDSTIEGMNEAIEYLQNHVKKDLRDYQYESVLAMITSKKRGGLVRSGEGTGKTRCMRALSKTLIESAMGNKSIVIVVPTLTIQRGIIKGFEELGLTLTPASGAKITIEPNVNYVMHQKTFLMHYNTLNDGNRYYIQDECHHAPRSIIDAINLWKSSVFGFTASPLRAEFKEEGFEMLYGMIHETGKESLPVKVIGIRKQRMYSIDYAMECQGDLAPDSYEIYRNMLNNDQERLNEIVELTMNCYHKTKKIIVFCDRILFANQLYEKLLEKCQYTFKITGKTSKQNIPKKVENLESFIIVGSIGCCGEGLDIPSLNTGILTFNTSNLKTIRQAAGRVRRNFGTKTCGYFIDIMDIIQIGKSKKYYGGISARKKVYQELGFSLQLL